MITQTLDPRMRGWHVTTADKLLVLRFRSRSRIGKPARANYRVWRV